METWLARMAERVAAPRKFPTLDDYLAFHATATAQSEAPIDRAILGGACADRVGYAFAAGYLAACQALVPRLGRTRMALCATETDGAHPKAIATTLVAADGGFLLNGRKRFCTLGPYAEQLIVLAREGEDPGGRPILRAVLVSGQAPGVALTVGAAMPFVPEVPHAGVVFEQVRVAHDDVLPGDGYAEYLKPFRTVEDIHVHAATLAYVASVSARVGSEHGMEQALWSCISAFHALAACDPRESVTHVALAGALARADELLERSSEVFQRADADERDRWARDSALTHVAEGARVKRLARAWERLRGS